MFNVILVNPHRQDKDAQKRRCPKEKAVEKKNLSSLSTERRLFVNNVFVWDSAVTRLSLPRLCAAMVRRGRHWWRLGSHPVERFFGHKFLVLWWSRGGLVGELLSGYWTLLDSSLMRKNQHWWDSFRCLDIVSIAGHQCLDYYAALLASSCLDVLLLLFSIAG